MSDIIQHETFTRVYEKTKAAMKDGLLAVAAISAPCKLTKGKEYRLRFDKMDDSIYYEDDAGIPVYLVYPEDLKAFEPLVDVTDILERVKDVDGRLQERVKELTALLGKIPTEDHEFKPGDVVVYQGAEEDKPYVIAKVLDQEERLTVGKIMETLVAHDLLVYHVYDGVRVSILPSYQVRKVGSLEEWGMEPLAPSLIEKLTVFSADPQFA